MRSRQRPSASTRWSISVLTDEARLEQVKSGYGHCLVVETVARHLAALAEEDETVGAVPGLNNVQSLMDLAPERLGGEIAAEEHRLRRLAKLGQGPIGRVLDIAAREPA